MARRSPPDSASGHAPAFRSTRAPDAAALQRHLPDRVAATLGRYRRGGRRGRLLRRLLALTLLVSAAVLANTQRDAAPVGTGVLAAAHDLSTGARVTSGDLNTVAVAAPPDGALPVDAPLHDAITSGPLRRGEILTDARLLGDRGPQPGPGRVAVPIRLDDQAVAGLLRPGMHVALVAVDTLGEGPADAHTVTDEAVVLSVPAGGDGGLTGGHGPRLALVSVPTAAADAVTTSAVTGSIGLRFP